MKPFRNRFVIGLLSALSVAEVRPSGIQVYFSPHGGGTEAIVKSLDAATKNVYVEAYNFLPGPIADALMDAQKRGVNVNVVLDKSQRSGKNSAANFLSKEGIPTWVDHEHAMAHSNIMIIDRARVITGSFEFTKASEELNAENLLIIDDEELAKKYSDNWIVHQLHSSPYPAGAVIKLNEMPQKKSRTTQ